MTGYQFIKAALAAGHGIVRVFFYHDGVCNAFMPPIPGELAAPDWSSLWRDHGVELIFCLAAAERRGLMRSDREPSAGLSPREGFQAGGLGLWVEACIRADRVLIFGGT